ncbi:MAG: hypothetical protein Q9214_007249 [Letrouitia sp. 1 TL-2023]
MDPDIAAKVSTKDQRPVGPQEAPRAVPVSKDRIWIDGCFDFSHHGHAGAMLQARRLGKELVVGVHSDQDIMDNKGPPVMTLKERDSVSAVEACRWSTSSVPYAPYVTALPWITHYGCYYVVHGDDITSDSGGEDCYRFVKAAGRFLVVKRTPGISTTDLVGRMLLCTKNHFIKSLPRVLSGEEGFGDWEERTRMGDDMKQRIKDYASDESGLRPGPLVLSWTPKIAAIESEVDEEAGTCNTMVDGQGPKPGQRIVYVDGGFDLFSSGHIEFLRQVVGAEETAGRRAGWYQSHLGKNDYRPAYVIAGVHNDEYIDCVIFGAPFTPTKSYLANLPFGIPNAIYHGPTSFMPLTYDPYVAARELGIYHEIGNHEFQDVNAGEIVQRILKSRETYEARQRAKGQKFQGEEVIRQREVMEREAVVLAEKRALKN